MNEAIMGHVDQSSLSHVFLDQHQERSLTIVNVYFVQYDAQTLLLPTSIVAHGSMLRTGLCCPLLRVRWPVHLTPTIPIAIQGRGKPCKV